MTKEEIFEYGKKHYPKGTLFLDFETNKELIVDDDYDKKILDGWNWIDETHLIVYCKDPKTHKRLTGRGFYIYQRKQWATILSSNNNLIFESL
jgi:hypothetical protein